MTGRAPKPAPPGETTSEYAGSLLGLPATGSGSLAPWGRRIAAVIVDWVVAQLVTYAFFRDALTGGGARSFVVLGVFAVLTVLSLSLVAATFGHWLLGLQLRQVRPGFYVGQVLARTLLLCLFLPAIFTASDGRGFHDVLAGTVLVRR